MEIPNDKIGLAEFLIEQSHGAIPPFIAVAAQRLARLVLAETQQSPPAPKDGDRRQRDEYDGWGNRFRVEDRFCVVRRPDASSGDLGRWELVLRALVSGPWLDEMKLKPGTPDPRD